MTIDVDKLLEGLDAEVPVVPTVVTEPQSIAQAQQAVGMDIGKAVNQHEAVVAKILANLDADRAETQKAINICFDRIEGNTDAKAAFIESLVQALKVKSDTNLTAVRALDATSKLIAAIKAKVEKTEEVDAAELSSLLANPPDPSEA